MMATKDQGWIPGKTMVLCPPATIGLPKPQFKNGDGGDMQLFTGFECFFKSLQ
jgi:hypothetical protein